MCLSNVRRILLPSLPMGLLCGILFSTISIGMSWIFALPPLFFISFGSEPSALVRWGRAGIAMLVLIGTVTLCGWLPVKALDRKIPAVHFESLSLAEVCGTLKFEHKIPLPCSALSAETLARVIDFETTDWMSKRDVANKFAHEQKLVFREGYCGTGATVLWGGHPSFCRLDEITSASLSTSAPQKIDFPPLQPLNDGVTGTEPEPNRTAD